MPNLLECLSNKRMRQQLPRTRPLQMIKDERLVQEILRDRGDVRREGRSARGSNLRYATRDRRVSERSAEV
jgi:hypothetical protein